MSQHPSLSTITTATVFGSMDLVRAFSRRSSVVRAALLVLSCAVSFPPVAFAKTTEVPPGAGTLQAAIDAAAPGDRLVLATFGLYSPGIVIDKPLRIQGNGATIDAECTSAVGIDIASDRVKLSKLGTTRATQTGIRIVDHTRISLDFVSVSLFTIREDYACGTEETAIEIAGSVDDVKLSGVVVTEDQSAFEIGLHLHDIPVDSTILLKGKGRAINWFDGTEAGVLIENCGAGSAVGGSGILMQRSGLPGDTDALRLVNTDGVLVKRNIFFGGGVSIDANSDLNRFENNDSDTSVPLDDLGTGNCGRENPFTMSTCN
ncbi:MAG TPA: hypothetical protein VN634_02490 [Candidatus Limnocylindrales bacterium]|nr:hypothetical protein [Candidatus Limnocylindrales bacterium]